MGKYFLDNCFVMQKCWHGPTSQLCPYHYLELLNELKFEVTAQVSQELSINFFNPLCLTHSISNANYPLFISCAFCNVNIKRATYATRDTVVEILVNTPTT